MTERVADPGVSEFGDLGRAYREVDWGRSPLGRVHTWSPVLRQATDLVLRTDFPATLLWGPEFALVYNRAYVEMIADKHPAALGRPAQEVFPEAWDVIGPMLEHVRGGQGSTCLEETHLPLHRRGFLEDCWFTFSYSPVRDVDGTRGMEWLVGTLHGRHVLGAEQICDELLAEADTHGDDVAILVLRA